MTLFVPFDGSELAEAALVRATEFGTVFDEGVLAVSVIPDDNADYARAHGWIGADEAFDRETITARLRGQVTDLSPSADFRHKIVDRYAPSGTVANRLRDIARSEGTSMAFIGSENAGHMVTAFGSVGGSIAADGAYDVVIVRHRSPAKIAKLRDSSPHRRAKSDFYHPR